MTRWPTPAPSPDPDTNPGFFDIGGDWAWPVARSNWPSFSPNGADWPALPILADGPSEVEVWRDSFGNQHVVLTRHYSAFPATLTRHFRLDPRLSVLECEQTLRYSPGLIEETPQPLTLWRISQVTNPVSFTIPVPSADFTPDVLSGTLSLDAWTVTSGGALFFATCTPPSRLRSQMLHASCRSPCPFRQGIARRRCHGPRPHRIPCQPRPRLCLARKRQRFHPSLREHPFQQPFLRRFPQSLLLEDVPSIP